MRIHYWLRQRPWRNRGNGKGFKYWLRAVVKSPYLQFGVGVVMFFSSLQGQQGTLYTDLANFDFHIHHGVNLMGIWNILQALPNMLDSISLIFNKWLDDD